MKLTVKQLKTLIKEQLEELSVPNAPPVPIHEEGACVSIENGDRRPPYNSLGEETEEGCHEGYTGSPADGGGVTGTQATSGAADVVKEAFNRRAYWLLEELKEELNGVAYSRGKITRARF